MGRTLFSRGVFVGSHANIWENFVCLLNEAKPGIILWLIPLALPLTSFQIHISLNARRDESRIRLEGWRIGGSLPGWGAAASVWSVVL